MDDKNELRVYDYIDIGVEMFARMYQKRMKEYTKLNYQMAEDDKTRANQTQLYNATNYIDPLQFDLAQAKKITMGFVSVRQMQVSKLKELKKSGKEIILLVKEEKFKHQQDTLENLQRIGIEVKLLSVNPFSFIICDEQIIWYGNLKFFIANKNDSTSLRLSNREIADKIIRQYID